MNTVIIFMLCLLAVAFIALIAAFIKNEINHKIRLKWIKEVSEDRKVAKNLDYSIIPDYFQTLFDMSLWKHIPLKDYLAKKKG